MTGNQPNYAEHSENFVKPTARQFALRELHAMAVNPKAWIGMAAVITMLTVMGPFGTIIDMNFSQRLVYWSGICMLTFPVAFGLSVAISVILNDRGLPDAVARTLAGAIAGLPVAAIVWLWNLVSGDIDPATFTGHFPALLRMAGVTVPISAAVSLLFYLVTSNTRAAADVPQATARAEIAFFKRLPVELGRDIISLQAQDHYVRVTTTRGSEMILIRLADAENELGTGLGERVHRSWWVAAAHASRIERTDGRMELVLSNGTSVPVSRSYREAAQALVRSAPGM